MAVLLNLEIAVVHIPTAVPSVFRALDWGVETPAFDIVAWRGGAGHVSAAAGRVAVVPSPYGLPVTGRGTLVGADSLGEVERLARAGATSGQVLLLHGALTGEPLTPRAFPFYSVEGHDRLREALEEASPRAIVSITGVMPELCGAVDAFELRHFRADEASAYVPIARRVLRRFML